MASTSKTKQSNLVERDTIIVNSPQLAQDFTHPEKVRLQFKKRIKVHPIDIGALAYTIRQRQRNHHLAHLPWLVDEMSFMPSRRKLLVKLHDSIVNSGNSDTSKVKHINAYTKIMTWFDKNGYSDAFDTEAKARSAYTAYVAELNHQIKSAELNEIIPITANTKQRSLITLLDLYWGSESTTEIIREVPVIKFKRREDVAPEEAIVRFATKTFLNLARGFKHFLMESKPFPYLLNMSDYKCYIFPSNDRSCITPYAKVEWFSYNYREGRISTPSEYILKWTRNNTRPYKNLKTAKSQISDAKQATTGAQDNLTIVNANSRTFNRLHYATLAMQSYMQLFILMTGINPAELVQLEYDDNFTLEKDLLKNDFRAIKMRAAGREVAYHLGSRKGLEIFKEYIELRNWVLNGIDCPYLFFSMEKKGSYTGEFIQMLQSSIYRAYRNTRGKFFPSSFTSVTARMVRKYKTVVWNELDVDQQVIADGLNHNIKTNHKSYAVSSPDRQRNEFGLFFEATKAAVKLITARADGGDPIPLTVIHDRGNSSSNTTKIASGHCNDFLHPDAMEDEPPIPPDCNSQMGCLYCEHYVCHSDNEDIKKLYSLLYVIEAVRNMAIDFNHSDKLLLELTVRIQLILTQMSAKSGDTKVLVDNIKEEVMEHGLLTPFWEFRLQRYEQMGVVI